MVHHSIFCMEERIIKLEVKHVLTESHQQLVIRINKMLETMCSEFKAYHYEIMVSLKTNEAAKQEQVYFVEHQRKTMEFVDRLGDLLAVPQLSVPAQASTNDRFVNS